MYFSVTGFTVFNSETVYSTLKLYQLQYIEITGTLFIIILLQCAKHIHA